MTSLRSPSIEPSVVNQLDWQFADAETRYLTHGIHRYSGKFIPQIARQAIELVTAEGDLVLDPYCGSGTTLLEAALSRRRSLGIDLNPLAILIARCKTKPVPIRRSGATIERIAATLKSCFGGQLTLSMVPSPDCEGLMSRVRDDKRMQDPWFSKWFQPAALEQLIAIDHLLAAVDDADVRVIGTVAFSDILRRSSNAHSGYPNVMFDSTKGAVQPPMEGFLKRFEEVARSVHELVEAIEDRFQPEVILGDATCLPVESESVDAVVTHPPYIASVPYAEYGALSLKWLGHEPGELDRSLTGGRRRAPDVVERFQEGFGSMLREAHRVLKDGRYLFMLVGSPVVFGKTIDLHEMSLALASEAGFQLAASGRRSGMNRRSNQMGEETALFFRKG